MPLVRSFSTSAPERSQFVIRCDASPWGFGGILEERGTPVAWWSSEITEQDRKVVPGEPGDPAFQAERELLAILISFATWASKSLILRAHDATASISSSSFPKTSRESGWTVQTLFIFSRNGVD